MPKALILIIEDNQDNYDMVRYFLQSEDYEVIGAPDGREGMRRARADKPDLILLDLTLPEVDGWTLAHQLKTDPETQGIIVVALTAHALPGDRKRALDAGCDGYITKPIDLDDFNREVQEYLAKKHVD
jgi:two-component system cell cycle response regulator DivK